MKASTVQSAERILLVGDQSAIGAALIQRLLHLGHPRSHIQVTSTTSANWSDSEVVHALMREILPDLVYVVEASDCPFDTEASAISSTALISAAAEAGVANLMFVGTVAPLAGPITAIPGGTVFPHNCGNHAAALQLCTLLASQGLNYRSVITCEPYGPCRPPKVPTRKSQAAGLIEDLLSQFTTALARGLDRVTIQAHPHDRLELMYLNDIAEAIVHVMDLPQATLSATTQQRSLHVDIGAEQVVWILELIKAVAAAVGFRGRFQLDPTPVARCSPRLDHHTLANLGWRPLISLETGLELSAMDFRLRHRTFQSTVCVT